MTTQDAPWEGPGLNVHYVQTCDGGYLLDHFCIYEDGVFLADATTAADAERVRRAVNLLRRCPRWLRRLLIEKD